MRNFAVVLTFLAATSSVFGQDAAPAPAAASASTTAASPVPSSEQLFTGWVDLGYRWNTGVYGNLNTYRSVVDLGSGPKLLGTEFTILSPSHRFFDRINVSAYNWGDDPYATVHVDVSKAKLYQFSGDYRNIAYFSNLPQFADPLLATNGAILDEQSLDTHKRLGDYRLELFPGARFVPYLEYNHSADSGTGVSTFVTNADEYPVLNLIRDSSENYRGGVRGEFSRLHFRLEQGGTTFKDDERMNSSSGTSGTSGTSGAVNYGNFLSPILGQTQDLTGLAEAWGVRGHSVYSSASFSANPVSWADLYGTFLYSEPVSNASFSSQSTGNSVLLSQILFYTGEQDLIAAVAKEPHVTASVGAEIRPFKKLRILPSWYTDRMHTTGASAEGQNYTTTAGVVPVSSLLSSELVTHSNRVETNLLYDLTRRFTIRTGYRYVWGNASDLALPASGLFVLDQGKIRSNVALAGISWHPVQNAWVSVDYEYGSSGSAYYRTSLYNYQRGRVRGRHQISPSFSVAASGSVLSNQDPIPGVNYHFLSHQESLSALYTPSGGKAWDFEFGYTRSTLWSDISYLDPEFLITQRSFYRDNSHTVNALLDLNLPQAHGLRTKLTVGGSAFLSSGSNPGSFFQPQARLSVALNNHLSWISEWRYYGFNEAYYLNQSFRTETVTTGVRITR